MEYSSTPFSCHSEERSDVGISGDGNHNRVWVPHPIVIPSMSSAETCLQGFPNDDIFGVIAFALVQIKAVGLRYKRTITVERSVVGIQRSESSACVRSTLHQAIGRAKLRQDFLPVLDLRAYARLCGEIARASKVLSNKRTLVAFTYAPLEQLLVRSRAKT